MVTGSIQPKIAKTTTSYLYHAFPDPVQRGVVIAQLYKRTADEGLLEMTMPGTVKMGDFAPVLDKPFTTVAFVDTDPPDCVGYGSIFELMGPAGKRRASVVYAFFRRWQGTRQMLDAALRTTSAWFRDTQASVLYGSILDANDAALQFALNFGFQEVGVAPNFYAGIGDGTMVALTKARFEERWRSLIEKL